MITRYIISAAAFLILMPLAAGLLDGISRMLGDKLLQRKGASIAQPINDVRKLISKEGISLRGESNFYSALALIAEAAAGCVLIAGQNMFLALALMVIGMVMKSAAARDAKYSLQAMCLIPALLICMISLYLYSGSSVLPMIGALAAMAFVFVIIYRGSNAEKLVSNAGLRSVSQITLWYEKGFMLVLMCFFFAGSTAAGWAAGGGFGIILWLLCGVVDIYLPADDNREMLIKSWFAAGTVGLVNVLMLMICF